jgi:cation diffusion facilitator CzcD-associated flavoprotein CzcO
MQSVIETRILIVGSGGNGISPAVYLTKAGIEDFHIITKHDDFGGTWYQNRYPGCATDVPVMVYQFSYALSADWQSTHGSQQELATYMQRVARQYGLYGKTDFNTELLEAHWLADRNVWRVVTNRAIYHAQFLVPATGFLEEPVLPKLPGIESFRGRVFHSSMWPKAYDGRDERVAVIGTGSSALQIVPALQATASQVYVFQRTPNYLLPLNRRYFGEQERGARSKSDLQAEWLEWVDFHEKGWTRVIGGDLPAVDEVRGKSLAYLAAIVTNPDLRRKLTPDFEFGCKRTGLSDSYYESLQQPNVELVAEGVTAVTPDRVITSSGLEFQVDTIVLATGFTFGGSILSRIKRRDGVTVAEYQHGHPRAYKSVSVAGCPNLFLVGGAGPNGQVWNGLAPGEFVPTYLMSAMQYMDEFEIAAMEVDEAAELEWKRKADEVLAKGATVSGGCANYSLDQHGFNKAAWPGTMREMQRALSKFDASVYHVVAQARVPEPS